VAVVEGAVVRIDAYDCTFDLGLEGRHDTFACLAETYLFARGGVRAHSVGRAEVDLALRMEALADRYGVAPRPLGLERAFAAEARIAAPALMTA
jgi:predicted amino acid dehydrogenase